MTIADLARRAGKLAIDNSPTILTAIGVVGTVTTAYLAGKASFEAADIIRLKEGTDYQSEEDRREPREVVRDRVELVWRLYIPAAATGVATLICIIGANHVGGRRAAGLAAACSITEKTFEEYKAKVVEKFGERKSEQVHDEIAQDHVNNTPLEDLELLSAGVGKLCYDMYNDRYFLGSVETIQSAVNDFNQILLHNGYATLADFYAILDLKPTPHSEVVGWNSDRFMEMRLTTTMGPGGNPAIAMSFKNEPHPDYARFH